MKRDRERERDGERESERETEREEREMKREREREREREISTDPRDPKRTADIHRSSCERGGQEGRRDEERWRKRDDTGRWRKRDEERKSDARKSQRDPAIQKHPSPLLNPAPWARTLSPLPLFSSSSSCSVPARSAVVRRGRRLSGPAGVFSAQHVGPVHAQRAVSLSLFVPVGPPVGAAEPVRPQRRDPPGHRPPPAPRLRGLQQRRCQPADGGPGRELLLVGHAGVQR